MTEIFVSTDIEANGPIPGPYSMLSFGSAAFSEDGKLIDTFYVNLELLDGAAEDPDTMEFWSKNQEAYNQTRINLVDPETAMKNYVEWIKKLPGSPVFVGYPAGFDFLFIYWYLIKFAGESPFSFSALDIKTYAMALLKKPYRKSTKKNMPSRWFSNRKHTHNALDDCTEQGELFMNMYKENNK